MTTRATNGNSNKKSVNPKSDKKVKKEEVKISAIRGLEPADNSEGKIIELVENTEGDYVERTIRSINETARSMLHESSLPEIFWSEAVNTAVYLRNRCPSSVLLHHRRCTPYEFYFGSKPSLGHLRLFGCNIWVHVPDETDKI